MTKILNLDEMLQVLKECEHELADQFGADMVRLGELMATCICKRFELRSGFVSSEGPMFGGTAAPFYLTREGQASPTEFEYLDEGEPLEYRE